MKQPDKKNTTPPSKRHKAKQSAPQQERTFLKLGRSLRSGGQVTVEKTRNFIAWFTAFTMGNPLPQSGKKHKKSRFQKRIEKHIGALKVSFAAFLGIIAVVFVLGVMMLENSSITVEEITVSVAGLPDDLEGYVILQISDLHGREFGQKQSTLLRSINNATYNLVLFTGDMVGKSGRTQPFYDLIDGMTANRKKYFISGDSDPSPILSAARDIDEATLSEMVLADWVLGAQERGADFLTCTTAVDVGASKLWLTPSDMLCIHLKDTLSAIEDELAQETEGAAYGIQTDYAAQPLTQYRYNQMLKQVNAAKQIGSGELHIALGHMPPSDEYLSTAQAISFGDEIALPTADLFLCGHYCGGGWRLPGLGAFYVPDSLLPWHGWFPDRALVQGLRQNGSTYVYTSPGLSVTDDIYLPNFRLFNSPTITLIKLTAAIDDSLI